MKHPKIIGVDKLGLPSWTCMVTFLSPAVVMQRTMAIGTVSQVNVGIALGSISENQLLRVTIKDHD